MQGESGNAIALLALALALYLILTFILKPKIPQVGKTYQAATFDGRKVNYNANSDGSISYTIKSNKKVIR